MSTQLLRLVVSTLVIGAAAPATAAATKDDQALKLVDEAMSVQYPGGKFDQAERTLRSALQACGARGCNKQTLGKIHVATGVVRSRLSPDLVGARKAFELAKKADPGASLDPKMTSPPVSQAVVGEFYRILGREVPREYERTAGPVGNLRCKPDSNHEIQTAQPIAVVCDPIEGAVRAELHYRASGESEYTALLMTIQNGTFRAQIPCEPLTKPGTLHVYVVAQDVNKEKVDSFGSAAAPARYSIVSHTEAPVPSYPDQDPPKRCSELLVGGRAQGQSCSATQPCKRGLYCSEGTCEQAPACESNSDCESEECNDGYCAMEAPAASSRVKPSRWMVGLHGGWDLWLATGHDAVCSDKSQRAGDFYCYNRGEERIYNDTSAKSNRLPMTDPNSGDVAAGFRPATVRVLASIDYVLTEHVSVGARLGWAFLGGPRAIEFDSAGRPSRKASFLPVHVEARGTLWLVSLGRLGFHPYVHLSAGVADVDAKVPINARLAGVPRKLDAWHRMGPAFAGAGFGVLYTFAPQFGVQLNLNSMLMLPDTGIVFEPTLGGVVGF